MSTFDPYESSGEETLERIEFLSFEDENEAKVYRSGYLEPISLDEFLQVQGHADSCIILIPYKVKSRLAQTTVVHESRQNIQRLIQHWDLPGLIVGHIMSVFGISDLEVAAGKSLWKSFKISAPVTPLRGFCPGSTYLTIGAATGDDPTPLRVLSIVDRGLMEKVGTAASTIVSMNNVAASSHLKSLWIHSLFIAAHITQWENCSQWAKKDTHLLRNAMLGEQQNVSLSRSMREAKDFQSILEIDSVYLESVIKQTRAISGAIELFPTMAPGSLQRAVYDISSNTGKRFYNYLQEFIALSRVLETERQLCAASIQINSLDFVRENIINIRNIAQSSQQQAEDMHEYAEQSRQDTRYMRRLALLTMCYLPSTTVAAIFSMPFFGLDDNLEFKSLSKLWIFFSASITLTALTFAVSSLWDMLPAKKANINEDDSDAVKEEAQGEHESAGLRPRPHVDLVTQVILDILRHTDKARPKPAEEASMDNAGSAVIEAK